MGRWVGELTVSFTCSSIEGVSYVLLINTVHTVDTVIEPVVACRIEILSAIHIYIDGFDCQWNSMPIPFHSHYYSYMVYYIPVY